MNSKDVLDVLEAMAAAGRLRRISSDTRVTKGIRYDIASGRQLQLELGNAVAQRRNGRLALDDPGQTRATVVLEPVPEVTDAPPDGTRYDPARILKGSHYADSGSRLTRGRQACFVIDTVAGLHALLDRYEQDDVPLEDAALLARFRTSDLFRAVAEKWTPEQTAAFCDIARAGHSAGLDWYFVHRPREPVRLGRKPDRDRRARATIGYLNDQATPRLWMSDRPGRPAIGANHFPLDAQGAAAFADALRRHAGTLAAWEAPTPARPGRWPDEAGIDASDRDEEPSVVTTPAPTNLILFGPPGTGKTYATAARAVALCGEPASSDRAQVMRDYHRLSDAGRIEFVTFHQSMAYEEFVEGLRPSSLDEDGQPLATGFRLAPTPGIFRRIAQRAEMSTARDAAAFTLGDRRVFKMSIGDSTKSEEAYLFDEAIEQGYAYLGFDDIDWSDDRFADRAAILAAVKEHPGRGPSFTPGAQPSLMAGPVKAPDLFRNQMKVGDVIVAAKGLSLFRAIGVVEGAYEYAPRGDGRYSHRRKVRWLWHDHDGVPVSEINARRFSIDTIHALSRENLNIAALERYANSARPAGGGVREQFVLVIDEINRANISKVFGELITLLEPDKRIGAANALRVQLPYSGDRFGVPANLHIIGTMNTADRSIALIDKALRRRFAFEEMMPDYTLDEMRATVAGTTVTLADVLKAINDRIEYWLDREHQIGHGWLLGCTEKAALDVRMKSAVIPLIAEYFFEDWGRAADVLGGREDNPFLQMIALPTPRGADEGEPRYRWSVREKFGADAYTRLIAG